VDHSSDNERLFTGYAGKLFITISLGWLVVQLSRQLLPPLLPTIIEDLVLTSTEAGIALTLMWALYAISQFPSGRLSDHLSRKTLLVSGLWLLSCGFLVLWGARAYPLFLIGVAIVGLGAGQFPSPARALLSDLYVTRRGQAFGVHSALGDLGNASAGGLAVVALAVATWNAAFLPVVVISVGILVTLHLWSRESYVFEWTSLDVKSTGCKLVGTARLRWLLSAYILFSFTWQAISGFLPTLLQFEKGFSVGLASTGFTVLFLVGMLVKPVAGVLGDRFGRLPVAAGALFLGVWGLAGLLVVEHTLAIFLAIGVFATGLMSFPPVMQAYLMDLFPNDSMGGDLGGMRTIYIGLGSLGPTYIGFVAERGSYTLAFGGLVGTLLLGSSIIGVYEWRRRTRV